MENTKINKLSVIVPAFKQEKSVTADLKNIVNTLKQIRYPFELIVVVDGREDGTYEQAKKLENEFVKVYGFEKNRGKGYAVRYGMARSSGDIIAFLDSGMEINPNGISLLLEHLEWYKADVIVGSKRHPASKVNYPLFRRILSLSYQILVFLLFGLKIKDTQVGLKVFRRKVLEDVLPRLLVKRYAFDVEMLAVAHYLGYKRIFEAPVEIEYNFSLAQAAKWDTVLNMLIDTLAIFYRLRILNYYSNKNKRKWRYDPELEFKVNVG